MKRETMRQEFSYTAVFMPEGEGTWVVSFPTIPGLRTDPLSFDDAREAATNVLERYIVAVIKAGATPPEEPVYARPHQMMITVLVPM